MGQDRAVGERQLGGGEGLVRGGEAGGGGQRKGVTDFVTVAVAVVNVKESISMVWKVEVEVRVPWVMVRVVLWMMIEVIAAEGLMS